MTVPFIDFPDMVAGVEVDASLTWDFQLPDGVTLTGTPTVTVENYRHSKVLDDDPQGRLVSTAVGTAENSTENCAVLAKFGPAEANVTYVFTVSCNRTDGGVAACYNKILASAPSVA